MNPTLSVCIATLNRADFIAATIESIAGQMSDEVEIVVLDGGSADGTDRVIAELQQRVPSLRYVRQDTNYGVDRDYDSAVVQARGRYCWLMSDDDLLKPGAIDAVLARIREDYGLIVVNTELVSFDLSETIVANRLAIREDRVFEAGDIDALFRDCVGHLGYIGAVVIRRDEWMARQREPYFGSNFIHIGVIFQAPLPFRAIALATDYVSVRFGNTQWRPREFEIYMVRLTELLHSFDAISENVRTQVHPLQPWRSVRSLFFYRAKGTYSLVEYRNWVRPRVTSRWDAFKAWCVAVFPGVLANLVGLVYCSFDYRESQVHFRDMKVSRFFIGNLLRGRATGNRAD